MEDKKLYELNDDELGKVSGGINNPGIQTLENISGIKLGQALPKNTGFTKSDDHFPSSNGF